MKLILLSMLATVVAAVSLAAVAQSAPTAQTVRVTEKSFSIALSAKPKAGSVKFIVKNASGDRHDLWLRGGGKTWKTRVIGGQRSSTLTATLKKGVRYTFWCGVGAHRAAGMQGSFIAR
jgi:uncharacterized cupredoxin-like copper-binding protein